MRKSYREKIKDAKKKYEDQIQMSIEDLLKLLVDGSRKKEERRMNPTQEAFIMDPTRITAYMGPAGCAKTSTLCAMGWIRSLMCPGHKTFIGRHDYNDLMGTTMGRMEEMLDRLPKGILVDREKSAPQKWYINPIPMPDPLNPGEVKTDLSSFTFMGMKDGLGSYEFHLGLVDEADEVDEKRVHELGHRLRAPGGWPFKIGMAFNPPDKHHWLYTACTGKDFQDRHVREPWVKCFVPNNKENVRNLPSGYYDELAKHLPDDMKARLVDGEWGGTFPGQPVYREFKYAWHVKDDLIKDWKGEQLFRFWDFGYNRPCCIWAYIDWEGRLKVLHEVLGEKEEARAFARRMKAISISKFPGTQSAWIDFGDRAVTQKKDTGQTLAEFHKEGITIRYRSMKIEDSVRLVRQRLNLAIGGEPAIQFDRKGCPILIQALRGGYHLDEKKGVEPVKDGFYDHLADAYRYGVVNLYGDGLETMPQVVTDYRNLPSSIEYTGE